MDIKDLRSRIDSIKVQNADAETDTNKQIKDKKSQFPDSGAELAKNGWIKIEDMVYERVSVIKNILPDVVSNTLLAAEDSPAPISQFIFYDTETTGLSAGAGNIVFLSGFGFVDGINFKIVQILLSDFPGEPAFLEHMKKYIKPERIYVSYNGKSFDANVLRSRYAMNTIQIEFGYQLDLLYSSRRLWKNIIGSCSLGDIERKVLDKRRSLDVPGFMVPDLYFDYIRTGRFAAIEGVIAHHKEDIASLAELLSVHEQLFTEAGNDIIPCSYVPAQYFDALGLASLLADSQPEKANSVLKTAFENGNIRAGIELGLMLKRAGCPEDAAAIWKKLWEETKSIFAAVELAKYLEHRVQDFEKAHSITCDILSLEHFRLADKKNEILKRKARLEKKIPLKLYDSEGCN